MILTINLPDSIFEKVERVCKSNGITQPTDDDITRFLCLDVSELYTTDFVSDPNSFEDAVINFFGA